MYWLAEKVESHIRVIVALPELINTFLQSRGISNPKYIRGWKSVRVPPFNEYEIDKLLGMLPKSVCSIARRYRNVIVELSAGHPRKVQCICSNLFNQAKIGHSAEELSRVIHHMGNYE